MNVTVNGNNIFVTLSKRNLESLLSKVNREGSRCTLTRETETGFYLSVKAQQDTEHYGGRTAGAIHPLDEPK